MCIKVAQERESMKHMAIAQKNQPVFDSLISRPANPERMARVKELCDQYQEDLAAARNTRAKLDEEVVEAREAGHSFHQPRDASSLSAATIHNMLAKRGVQ